VAARYDSQVGLLNSSSSLAKKALSAAAHTANKTLKTLTTLELLTLDDVTLTEVQVSAEDITSHNFTAAAVAAAATANKLQAKVKATAAKLNHTVAKQTAQAAASKDDKKVAVVQGSYTRSHSGTGHMKTCEDQRTFAFDKCFGRAKYQGQVLTSIKAAESRTKAAALGAKMGDLKTALVHAKKAAAAAAKAANSSKTLAEIQLKYPTFAGLDEDANGEDVSASVEEDDPASVNEDAPETTFTEVSAGKKESKACKKNIAGAYETCHRIVDKAYATCAILYKQATKGVVTAIATPQPATAPAAVKTSPTTAATATSPGAAGSSAPSTASPTAAQVPAKVLAAASIASASSAAPSSAPVNSPASSTSSPASASTPTPTFSTSLTPPPTPTPTLPPGVKPSIACIIVVPQDAKKGNCTSVLHAGQSCSFTCPKGTVLTGPTTCTQHPTAAVLNTGMCSPLTCDTKIGQWCPAGSSIVEASVCAAAAKLNNATFSVETVKASVRAPEGCYTETGTDHYTLNQNTQTSAPGNRAIVSICKCDLMGNATANQTAAAVAAGIAEASEPESEPESDGDSDSDSDDDDGDNSNSDGDGDGTSTSLLESPEPEPAFEEE